MSALSQMYPNITVPQPINTYIPRWHSDRFFRGSYSAAKIGVTDDLFNGM
jgi:polyamine oxidase